MSTKPLITKAEADELGYRETMSLLLDLPYKDLPSMVETLSLASKEIGGDAPYAVKDREHWAEMLREAA